MKRLMCILLAFLLICPAMAETVQDQALAFIQAAGIEADSVTRIENQVIVSLTEGGTASLYMSGDFDAYDLGWRFEGASDPDLARYLDHALSLLAGLEAKIPAADERRARNYAVMVSNSLLSLEWTGDQGLRILLEQLSRHDDSGLNSLRARLASRLLGERDATPVDPAEGLAWYDALVISVQDDLPPVDASLYEDDPLLAAASNLLMAQEDARRADQNRRNVDGSKTRTIVALKAAKTEERQDSATIWGMMYSSQYALYDGIRIWQISGWIPPLRIEMKRVDGEWALDEVIYADDGECYGPSILRFCDEDRALQQAVMTLERPDMEACLRAYLTANGYGAAVEE